MGTLGLSSKVAAAVMSVVSIMSLTTAYHLPAGPLPDYSYPDYGPPVAPPPLYGLSKSIDYSYPDYFKYGYKDKEPLDPEYKDNEAKKHSYRRFRYFIDYGKHFPTVNNNNNNNVTPAPIIPIPQTYYPPPPLPPKKYFHPSPPMPYQKPYYGAPPPYWAHGGGHYEPKQPMQYKYSPYPHSAYGAGYKGGHGGMYGPYGAGLKGEYGYGHDFGYGGGYEPYAGTYYLGGHYGVGVKAGNYGNGYLGYGASGYKG
ncbi:extensin-3-like [Lingula anatina]|uniref:Extensin-3-like n=1 Tax=Lingula anatina TaxID=7574 RepID=A0A2R2MIU1_LINAN|nr:extensin-3-like [Lingula anatina]|eukprot:XP_023930141.1 extensin-3-like [Lingula anatina]